LEKNSIKRITTLAILTAVALVLGYVESLFPLNFGVPGIKLGLANTAVLLAIILMGRKEGLLLLLAKVLLSAVLFAGFAGTVYGLAGGLLSWTVMAALKDIKAFSSVGISVAGAAAHNLGQILVAMLLTGSTAIIGYFPILLISGTIAGVLTGLIAQALIRALKMSGKGNNDR